MEETESDFVGLTETWIHSGGAAARNMCPPGFRFIGKSRKIKPDDYPSASGKPVRGGGVGFMFKSAFTVWRDDSLDDSSQTVEHLMVDVKASIPLRVSVLYRPPPNKRNGFTDDQFIADVDGMLTELSLFAWSSSHYGRF